MSSGGVFNTVEVALANLKKGCNALTCTTYSHCIHTMLKWQDYGTSSGMFGNQIYATSALQNINFKCFG